MRRERYFFTVQWGSEFKPNTTQVELKKLPLGVQAEIVANTESQSAAIQLLNLDRLAAGTYTILVALSDGQFSNTKRITIQKIPPTTPTRLLLPKNEAENIAVPANFQWQDTNNAATFQLELALDSTFTKGLSTYTTNLNSYTKRDSLLQDTTYFWRVITQSTCDTDTSVVFQFSTERPVGIQTLPNSYFSVHPNPTISQVQVAAVENKLLRMEVNVIAPDGRRIKQEAGYEIVTIDLSNYPSGIYLLQIITSEGMLWKKVLLE
ncbi:MAG: T9SS type A sorting domain-containing protein [Saprospiraceae bacterium]|nr:T9SS type A sorting domain-containing protein [Saprospiraceae bacterium]